MLSFCIAVKNRSRVVLEDNQLLLLPNCVRSIVASTRDVRDCEIVVADWASDDWPLAEWLDHAAHPLPVRVVQADGGFSRGRGRNLAAEAAKGDILFFVDADSLISPAVIEQGMREVDSGRAFFPVVYSFDSMQHSSGWWRHTGYGNCMMTRATFERAGRWPDYATWGNEDDDFFARVADVAPVARAEVEGFFHQWHPEDILWKDRYANLDPAAVQEILGGRAVVAKVDELLPPHAGVILVDEDRFAVDEIGERPTFAFLEADGEYFGLPADDQTAIAELERLRGSGASYIVFPWLTFWWFDHYGDFASYLTSRYRQVLADEELRVFDLTG